MTRLPTTKAEAMTAEEYRAAIKKQPKYRNQKCELNGEKYRSKREMRRHQVLLQMQRDGLISNLRREVPYVLAPAVRIDRRTKPAIRYYADFVYDTTLDGQIVEDCKGARTTVFSMKRHLMATVHNIQLLLT